MHRVNHAIIFVTQMCIERACSRLQRPFLLELSQLRLGQVLDGIIAEATVVVTRSLITNIVVVVRVDRAGNGRRGHVGRGQAVLSRHSLRLFVHDITRIK